MIDKKFKTFKINISENVCKCYIIKRNLNQETLVEKVKYEDLINLLKKEKDQLDKKHNIDNNSYFFIYFFGILFSFHFFISVFLYHLIN